MLTNIDDLRPGDIIFTVADPFSPPNLSSELNPIPFPPYAHHIAMCSQVASDPKKIRIIHCTDRKGYFALCHTKLLPSSRLTEFNRHYEVIRCTNNLILAETLKILNTWASFGIPFDLEKVYKLEDYEDSKPNIDMQCQELRERFLQESYAKQLKGYIDRRKVAPFSPKLQSDIQEGFFCSSVFVYAFQIAALLLKNNVGAQDISTSIPTELHLDAELTGPTLLLNNFLNSSNGLFAPLGTLQLEYVLDAAENAAIENEKKAIPKHWWVSFQQGIQEKTLQAHMDHVKNIFLENFRAHIRNLPVDQTRGEAKLVMSVMKPILFAMNLKKWKETQINTELVPCPTLSPHQKLLIKGAGQI